MADFRKAYPGIRIRLSNHSTPETIQEVKDGLVDLAVVSTPADIPATLKSTSLMDFSDVMAVSYTHLFWLAEIMLCRRMFRMS